MKRRPTYLRVVVSTRCNLACSFCHLEGDPQQAGTATGLERHVLDSCLAVAVRCGMRKIKFLGGEPLLRTDLPEVIGALRARSPSVDLSVITAGVIPASRLEAVLQSGLNRVNVSIHGFTPTALARNIPSARAHQQRQAFLEALLATCRPTKLNYVYGSVFDRDDLGALLAWAAPRGLLVGVLDDLNRHLTPGDIAGTIQRLRGAPLRIERDADVDSLDTAHWIYADGLRIEIKDQHLGDVAPFGACQSCPKRARCREGIFALRLTHDGFLQPCMDRPDLRLPLAAILRDEGEDAAVEAWQRYVEVL